MGVVSPGTFYSVLYADLPVTWVRGSPKSSPDLAHIFQRTWELVCPVLDPSTKDPQISDPFGHTRRVGPKGSSFTPSSPGKDKAGWRLGPLQSVR